MIELRPIYHNVPSGKFHSVLMTTYSINLYYWDIQFIPMLSKKGINFVSALVDADCLSEQLYKYSKAFSDNKSLEYSLHGYKSKGAFHPKIQFFAGRESVLVLVGSGNITLCGHGNNMEVWTPIMVGSTSNPAFPFVCEVWNYLKSLYLNLGDEANNIIRSVEENCLLLQSDYNKTGSEYHIDEHNSIRLFTNGEHNIFNQCKDWISNDDIIEITILSPFYDSRAELIKALKKQYHPKKLNVIVEDGFGAAPLAKYIPEKVNLYKWSLIRPEKSYQKFYHAKCIFFKGKKFNYILCGSTNASVAAFGLPGVPNCNHEASIGFKSDTIDYFKETGFILTCPVCASDIENAVFSSQKKENTRPLVWIKESSYDYDRFSLTIESSAEFKAYVVFYSGNRSRSLSLPISIKEGIETIQGDFNVLFSPLYVELQDTNGKVISNLQFVISTNSMILNNPSRESVKYRRICHEIETGQFISGSVLRFIEQVLTNTEGSMSLKAASTKSENKKKMDDKGFVFDSLEDYLFDDGSGITGAPEMRRERTSMMRSSMLLDSMISYISRSSKEKEQEEIDEEETEDIKQSVGKEEKKDNNTALMKQKTVDDVIKRIIKMFDTYLSYLLSHTGPHRKVFEINLMNEIKRYMASIYFIHRLLSFRYTQNENSNDELPLLRIFFSETNRKTTSEYLFRIVNAFSVFLLCNNCKKENDKMTTERINNYKRSAFELTLAVLSVCDWLNEGNDAYKRVQDWHKQQTLKNIEKVLSGKGLYLKIDIKKQLDRATRELPSFNDSHIQQIANSNQKIMNMRDKSCVLTKEFGYVLLSNDANGKTATPCTMLSDWKKDKKWFAPDYAYMHKDHRLLPIKPRQEMRN